MKQNQQTQLQNVDLNQIHQIGEYGIAEVMAMKDTVGKDLSIPQFNLFMYDCNRLKLDPRLKHAFPIMYNGKLDIRISFEGYHAMAQDSEGYIGLKTEVVCENELEDFYAETDDDGDMKKPYHKVKFPRGKVVGAYAIAKREGKKDLVVFCDKPEFEKYAKKNGQFWKLEDGSLDPDMCKKFAGIRAIKGQFAIAAVAEESTEALNISASAAPYETPVRRDITQEADALAANQKPQEPPETEQPPQDDEAEKMKQARAKMSANFKALGITDKAEKSNYIAERVKTAGGAPTLAEMLGLLKIMDKEIAAKQAADDDDLLGPLPEE